MRRIDDCTYQEYKEGVSDAFHLWEDEPERWTPKDVTNYIAGQEEYADHSIVGASELLWFVSLGEYEVSHNILEDRILNHLSYHIYRYENMGRYKSDLTEEEIEQVEKDIAYIKSKVELQKLVSYEDFD